MQKLTGGKSDLLECVRAQSSSLSPSEQKVAEYVLAAPHHVLDMSAGVLAKESATSVGTVVRFCASIGQPGYQSFKQSLAVAMGQQAHGAMAEEPELESPAQRMVRSITRQLTRSAQTIDPNEIRTIAKLLAMARRTLILSTGPSQPIAMTLGYFLNGEGHQVSYPMDHETQALIASRLGEGDVCVVVSHSGESVPVLRSARIALDQGATLVALTSFSQSALSALSTHAIVAGAPADTYRTADAASRPTHLALVHALMTELYELTDLHSDLAIDQASPLTAQPT